MIVLPCVLFGNFELQAATAANAYVTVSCSTYGVEDIVPVGADFYITTRNVSKPSFRADIRVKANSPYYLVKPGGGRMNLGIGESDEYRVRDESGNEDEFSGHVYVLKLDIEPAETNVCWKSTICTLKLTNDSFPGGTAEWTSSPAGISGSGRSITFNPNALAAGVYTVTAKSGIVPEYYDSCNVTIDLVVEVSDICILSPAIGHGWPYDPVWHDPEWMLSVNGENAEQSATDADAASISYALSKDARDVEVYLYKDLFGPINQLVQLTGGTKRKGVNSISGWWMISSEDNGEYFAKVVASGCHNDEISRGESSLCKIERRDYFTATAPNTVSSVGMWKIFKYTRAVAESLVLVESTVILTIGHYYLAPARMTISTAISLGFVENIFSRLVFGSFVPDWINDGNSVYMYGPWMVTQYWWDSDAAAYVTGDPGTGVAATWSVSCSEVFHSSVATPPPTSGVTPLHIEFHNNYTDDAFSEEEMRKTPWAPGLNHNAYGLKAPQLMPVSHQGGE